MKCCAALTAKLRQLRGKILNKKNKNFRKNIIPSLSGTTFLVCGFFYLFFAANFANAPKNSSFIVNVPPLMLSVVSAKTQTESTEQKSSRCRPPFLAKNADKPQIQITPFFCDKDESLDQTEEKTALSPKKKQAKQELLKILKQTPMEEMIDPVLEQEKTVAAFLVGIAFKESKFGVYSPKKNGKNCYNYWGFKGKTNPTKSGYSCFDTPEQAVQIVGKRLEELSIGAGRTRPAQMTIWKCGSSCAAHSPQSVQKWIADVTLFYNKVNILDI